MWFLICITSSILPKRCFFQKDIFQLPVSTLSQNLHYKIRQHKAWKHISARDGPKTFAYGLNFHREGGVRFNRENLPNWFITKTSKSDST